MNTLGLVLALIVSGVVTVYACVGLNKLWALYLDWSTEPVEEPGARPRDLPRDIFGGYYVSPVPPIGRSLIGQRPEPIDDDSAFWEGRPAHPDRPDEDWPG